jgi:hypothetical protein
VPGSRSDPYRSRAWVFATWRGGWSGSSTALTARYNPFSAATALRLSESTGRPSGWPRSTSVSRRRISRPGLPIAGRAGAVMAGIRVAADTTVSPTRLRRWNSRQATRPINPPRSLHVPRSQVCHSHQSGVTGKSPWTILQREVRLNPQVVFVLRATQEQRHPKAPTHRSMDPDCSTRSPPNSTPDPANAPTSKPPPKPSSDYCPTQPNLLHRQPESKVATRTVSGGLAAPRRDRPARGR